MAPLSIFRKRVYSCTQVLTSVHSDLRILPVRWFSSWWGSSNSTWSACSSCWTHAGIDHSDECTAVHSFLCTQWPCMWDDIRAGGDPLPLPGLPAPHAEHCQQQASRGPAARGQNLWHWLNRLASRGPAARGQNLWHWLVARLTSRGPAARGQNLWHCLMTGWTLDTGQQHLKGQWQVFFYK